MKDYPRIHSLGAINIIHHQNFDYDFHPFRTDFTGDSGVGKSIITDLIQLIIIGSTEYESSTDAQGDRPFNTLVIESKEKGDFGYAYLNVEIEKEKYLLIGCYIERKSKKSQSFIVQGSLDFDQEKFSPFNNPIIVEDFLENDQWLPLHDFDAKMNHSQNFGCRIYNIFRDYHLALLSNNLLPIDIANSRSNLIDYAKILQAFSRKGISIKNDVQLQEFLFGKEQQHLFYNEYRETVKQLEDTVALHRQNKDEIESLKLKASSLNTLYELKKTKDAAFKEFIVVDWNYQKLNQKTLNKQIKGLLVDYFKARNIIDFLNGLKGNKLEECKMQISKLQPEHDTLETEFKKLSSKLDFVRDCRKIMKELELPSPKKLQDYITSVIEQRQLKESLKLLNATLKERALSGIFPSYDFSEGSQQVLKNIAGRMKSLDQELSMAQELLKFNDFENPETLSYWILKRNKSCTREEESVLRHFQDLKTLPPEYPKKGDKFILDPEEIIDQLRNDEIKKNDTGMWLHLSGLKIFIEFVEKQVFNTDDNKKIKELLLESRRSLEAEVQENETFLHKLEILQSFILDDLPNIPNAIPAWLSREKVVITEEDEEQLSKVLINDYEAWLKEVPDYEEIKKKHGKLKVKLEKLKSKLGTLNVIETQLPAIETIKLESVEETLVSCAKSHHVSQDFEQPSISFDEKLFAVEFQKEYANQRTIINGISAINSLMKNKRDSENRLLQIETEHSEIIPERPNPGLRVVDFEDSQSKYQDAQNKYSEQFTGILIGNQLQNRMEQFENDKNFLELVRLLLPQELFRDISFDEAAVIPKILEYLEKINDANARINQNKLIKIRDLLQKLQSAVNTQVSHCKRINGFFKEDYAQITGRNSASLKAKLREDISLEWIRDFLTSLSQLEYGLFDRENSLTSKLEKLPTLEEKIHLAYKEHSKTPLPNIKVRQLLNPYSYYTLDYELITQSGKKNSGSTGQTYTSLALLCIAKLSLIKDGKTDDNRGLRFLSIDEAEGIGSNFDTLKVIANKYDYQVISLGISPNKLSKKNQYIYRLSKRKDEERINHHPSVIFCEL